jgi:hypothetical protein
VISSALSLSSALFESLANPRCFIFKRKEYKDDKSADILRGSGEAQLRMAGQVLPAAQGNIRIKMADLKLETHTEVAHFSELYSTEMVTLAPLVLLIFLIRIAQSWNQEKVYSPWRTGNKVAEVSTFLLSSSCFN